jgi:hypothetical protein
MADVDTSVPSPDAAGLMDSAGAKPAPSGPRDAHPSGKESYGRIMQILRGLAFAVYFNTCCIAYAPNLVCPRQGSISPVANRRAIFLAFT